MSSVGYCSDNLRHTNFRHQVCNGSIPYLSPGINGQHRLSVVVALTPTRDFDGLALVVGAGMNNSSLLNFESATNQCNSHYMCREFREITSPLIGSGIGREVAFTLASRGVSTLVCAGINLEAARETSLMSNSRKSEHSGGYKVHALEVDTRDEMSVQRMVDETKSLFGRIDHFVSTAGVSVNNPCSIRIHTYHDNS